MLFACNEPRVAWSPLSGLREEAGEYLAKHIQLTNDQSRMILHFLKSQLRTEAAAGHGHVHIACPKIASRLLLAAFWYRSVKVHRVSKPCSSPHDILCFG